MARIDAAYNYLLSTYGKATGSRYDSIRRVNYALFTTTS